jgi:UDP-2,3-diacylglucosamine pyrophosphatase LpxH
LTLIAPAVRLSIRLIGIALVAAVVLGVVAGWGARPAILAYAVLAVLVAAVTVYRLLVKYHDGFYRGEIARGLDRACRGKHFLEETVPLDELRLIVMSDQHRGTRDGADDFWRSERAYSAALGHYFEKDYRLVVLGDGEELWECRPQRVVAEYREVLSMEARFHADSRYERVWGNHDDDWRKPRLVDKYLRPVFERHLAVREGLKLNLTDHGEPLGTLLFVHGHQGTWDSEIFSVYARPLVRVFGFLQRLFKKPWNTPATDWKLRARHDTAMFEWARDHATSHTVLITGHTHRPVFWNSRPEVPTEDRLRRLREDLAAAHSADARAAIHAELLYLEAERRYLVGLPRKIDPPCYFNTGCCSFSDGDVTGLQMSNREIRLVRFPDNHHKPRPECLARESLTDVFDAVRAYAAPSARVQ